MVLIVVVILWAIFGGLGAWIAEQKHRSQGEGFALGLLFGPLGVLIEALLPTLEPKTAVEAKPTIDPDDRERRKQALAQQRERIYVERQEWLRRQDERREWINRMVWRFGWFKLLPEAVQPIVVGLVVALPIVGLIIALAR